MGAMFRSEEMTLAQLFIQPEAAYFSISELGETGTVQFRDLNENVNAFQRKFVNEVRRCDEMERKLRYIESEVRRDDVTIPDVAELPKAPNPREIIDLEAHLEKTEGDIKDLSESAVSLKSNYLELIELKEILDKTQTLFIEQDELNGMESQQKALIPEESHHVSIRGRLGFVAGVINRERVPAFERMLWRISRGNVFLRQHEIDKPLEDPASGHQMNKTVFVAFFQGEQLKSRIKKVCAGFHASLYPCPSTARERDEMMKGVKTRLEDLNLVLNQTQDHRQRVLMSAAKELQNWTIMVRKMKAIYHTLNLFNMDVTKKCLIGECWVPSKDIPIVQKALTDGSSACGSSMPSFLNVINTTEDPPTFNRTNKFTKGFQNLIDSYGIASYREANPALYTIISFPFLFAIMFGDVGHAILMGSFGLSLILSEKRIKGKKINNEIFSIFFAGRYIIFLMGVFSLYTGFIYNDVFSKSMNIFGSSWFVKFNDTQEHRMKGVDIGKEWDLLPELNFRGTPYFMGVDPLWAISKNKILFLNSYKMKLSIVFGVVHMIFGVCVSVVNYVHFRKYSSIFLEFLPQILLLCFLFLWMVAMIFIKWIKYMGDNHGDTDIGSSCAPSVLIFFINMMLFKKTDKLEGCKQAYMFEAQPIFEKIFVYGALLCIPVLLFGKPIFIFATRRRRSVVKTNGDIGTGLEMNEVSSDHQKDSGGHHNEEDEPMSEILIHQGIHTIEYVLSTISHTASYLRLWALSLAHAQLSEVLWNMVFQKALIFTKDFTGAPLVFLLFAPWAVFTVAILVTMEGLSAFLHTLRLHWVEFMSKFYSGLGYPFQPFSFKTILEEDSTASDE